MLLGACAEHPVQPVVDPAVASLGLDRERLDLTVGASGSLAATAHDSAGNQLSGRVVFWASSDTAVAAVSAAGVVNAVGMGLATITATVEGWTAEAVVAVVLPWPGVVSDPGAPTSITSTGSARLRSPGVVHVSLAPGTIPGGEEIVIGNRATDATVSAFMTDGGLDPLAVPANAGDTLDLEVRGPAPAGTHVFLNVVPARRRPRVVRTDPPARRRDVPLSSVIILVFSEPMDAATVTAGTLRLTALGQLIGSELVVTGGGLRAELRPLLPLAAQTDYQVFLDTSIADLDADRLESPHTIDFTTESGPVKVASITVTPDSAVLAVGQTVALAVATRDSSGAVLLGRTVTWASTNGAVVTVSDSGWVSGVAAGSATVTATVDGASDTVRVRVDSAALVAVRLTTHPGDSAGALGAVNQPIGPFRVIALDSMGRPVTGIRVIWTVTEGGGSISPWSWTPGEPAGDTTANVGNAGSAWARLTLGPNEGPNRVTVTSISAPGEQITYWFTAATTLIAVTGRSGGGFVPDTVSVPAGRTVGFTWSDWDWIADHNVVFEDDSLPPASSELLKWHGPRDHRRVFLAPGEYRFRCSLHSTGFVQGEVGVVVVRQ